MGIYRFFREACPSQPGRDCRLLKSVIDELFSRNHRQVDSNKFQYLPEGCLEYLRDLESIKLAKNPWHCDCSVLYVAK